MCFECGTNSDGRRSFGICCGEHAREADYIGADGSVGFMFQDDRVMACHHVQSFDSLILSERGPVDRPCHEGHQSLSCSLDRYIAFWSLSARPRGALTASTSAPRGAADYSGSGCKGRSLSRDVGPLAPRPAICVPLRCGCSTGGESPMLQAKERIDRTNGRPPRGSGSITCWTWKSTGFRSNNSRAGPFGPADDQR